MSQYDNLKATIALNVYQNHNNEVTANMVKAAMDAMTDSLGAGYQYLGIATPTSPGTAQTPDQKVFYIATTPGTYTNFSGLVVNDGEVAVLKWDTAWHKEVTGAATAAQVTELGHQVVRTRGSLPSTDLNTVRENGFWILVDSFTYQNVPNNATLGFLRVSVAEDGRWYLQEFFDFGGGGFYKRRSNIGGNTWEAWQLINQEAIDNLGAFVVRTRGALLSTDLNDVRENGFWILVDSQTYQNVPDNESIGFLRVSVAEQNIWAIQEFISFSGGKYYKRRFQISSGTFETWQEISSGGTIINNNYEYNSYPQTINVTATPTITTDTNNYLASTGDSTDRTADILALLNTTGICHLGPGVFYVANLIMPDNTTIVGCGKKTRVCLLTSVTDGFAIRMGTNCTVSKMFIDGQRSGSPITATVGTRHGILWQGDYTQSETAPSASIISDVFISNFEGGGITCYDTGYGTYTFISATNVLITQCDAGINISYWSEFHKFTNVRTCWCYYGCINNGGNNIFVNCDFSTCNGKAFVMDNSQQQSPNNSHGSCIGCVFNHTASNTGVGIEILGCESGFIFTGCQIFFSKTNIVNSLGIVIADCNFGKNNCDITVSGGGAILFANNMHQDAPPAITITGNDNVHFVNCYNRETGAAIQPLNP